MWNGTNIFGNYNMGLGNYSNNVSPALGYEHYSNEAHSNTVAARDLSVTIRDSINDDVQNFLDISHKIDGVVDTLDEEYHLAEMKSLVETQRNNYDRTASHIEVARDNIELTQGSAYEIWAEGNEASLSATSQFLVGVDEILSGGEKIIASFESSKVDRRDDVMTANTKDAQYHSNQAWESTVKAQDLSVEINNGINEDTARFLEYLEKIDGAIDTSDNHEVTAIRQMLSIYKDYKDAYDQTKLYINNAREHIEQTQGSTFEIMAEGNEASLNATSEFLVGVGEILGGAEDILRNLDDISPDYSILIL